MSKSDPNTAEVLESTDTNKVDATANEEASTSTGEVAATDAEPAKGTSEVKSVAKNQQKKETKAAESSTKEKEAEKPKKAETAKKESAQSSEKKSEKSEQVKKADDESKVPDQSGKQIEKVEPAAPVTAVAEDKTACMYPFTIRPAVPVTIYRGASESFAGRTFGGYLEILGDPQNGFFPVSYVRSEFGKTTGYIKMSVEEVNKCRS